MDIGKGSGWFCGNAMGSDFDGFFKKGYGFGGTEDRNPEGNQVGWEKVPHVFWEEYHCPALEGIYAP
jgi:hypothetical protein